jgi:hypothetical protein
VGLPYERANAVDRIVARFNVNTGFFIGRHGRRRLRN